MKKSWIVIVAAGVAVIGVAVSAPAFAKENQAEISSGSIRLEKADEARFPDLAKVTFVQAAQHALAEVPGKVLKAELEDENGFLVYGVEVVTADRTVVDVKVDAGSGKVLAKERDRADENERAGFGERGEEDHERSSDRDRED